MVSTLRGMRKYSTVRASAKLLGGMMQLSPRSEEHTSELQSRSDLVCRLLLEKKKKTPPNEPTLIALHEPLRVQWQILVTEAAPLPTPRDKRTLATASRAMRHERRTLRAPRPPQVQ